MPSEHYRELVSSLDELREHLLPQEFDAGGDYPDKVFTGVVAFRLLSHAAIEDYLEARVIEIAIRASSHSNSTGDISLPAAHLASFNDMKFGSPPASLAPPRPNQNAGWPERIDLVARVVKSSSLFVKFAQKDNHGVKEKNLMMLLIPVGLKHSDIDPLLVSELDNFGERRGDFAHSSASKHVRNSPNPEDELNNVLGLLVMLEDLDEKLDRTLASIPPP